MVMGEPSRACEPEADPDAALFLEPSDLSSAERRSSALGSLRSPVSEMAHDRAYALGRQFQDAGYAIDALGAYGRAIDLAPTPAQAARALRYQAILYLHLDLPSRASPLYEDVLRIGRETGDVGLQIDGLNGRAGVRDAFGDPAGAAEILQASLALADAEYSGTSLCERRKRLAMLYNLANTLKDAGRQSEFAQAVFRAQDLRDADADPPFMYAYADQLRGSLLRLQGDLEGSKRALESVLPVSEGAPSPHFRITLLQELVKTYAALGESEAALRAAAEAKRIDSATSPDATGGESRPHESQVSEIHNMVGLARTSAGDHRGAAESYRDAFEVAQANFVRRRATELHLIDQLHESERIQAESRMLRSEARAKDAVISRQRSMFAASGLGAVALLSVVCLAFQRQILRTRSDARLSAVRVAQQERERISRELHDTVLQNLAAIAVTARNALTDPPAKTQAAKAPAGASGKMDNGGEAQTAFTEILDLARQTATRSRLAIDRYRDSASEPDVSLRDMLDRLAEQAAPVGVELKHTPGPTLPRRVPALAAKILREAVGNAVKHSGARKVDISARKRRNGWVEISVVDNGHGFDATKRRPSHWGLDGMRERASMLGGQLDIMSGPAGTRVELRYPGSMVV